MAGSRSYRQKKERRRYTTTSPLSVTFQTILIIPYRMVTTMGRVKFKFTEQDKQTVSILNLLSHYIAIGGVDGIPLAYEQSELFDWKKLYIAENIRLLRLKNNMTLTDLARKLDKSYSAVAKYETYRVKPTDSTLRKLARIFRVDVSEFSKEVDL